MEAGIRRRQLALGGDATRGAVCRLLYRRSAGGSSLAEKQKPDVRAARLPNSYHIINDDYPRTCIGEMSINEH